MKTLTLLRHAKSGWDDPIVRDFDRPLNGRGRRAATAVGREMRDKGLEFDRVIASPALRVVETVARVAEAYGRPIEPAYDRRVYLATAPALLDVVRETDDCAGRLLLVGHNPGLEALALLLTRKEKSNGLRSELSSKYPTGAVAEISFAVDHWGDVAPGGGNLERFFRPRDLDPRLGPEGEG